MAIEKRAVESPYGDGHRAELFEDPSPASRSHFLPIGAGIR